MRTEEVAAMEVIQGVLASQTLHAERAELARSFPRCLAPRSVPLDSECGTHLGSMMREGIQEVNESK